VTREFIFGAIRAVIQIGVGVVGWFLYVRFGTMGGVIGVLMVFYVFVAFEIVRAKRFKRLFAERVAWIREDKFRRGYLPLVVLAIIGFAVLSGDLYLRMNLKWVPYSLLLGISLWDEVWLAHKRYPAD